MARTIVISVEVPALDRLMDYLEAKDQPEVDAMAASVKQVTDSLRQSADALQGAVTNQRGSTNG